MAKNKRRKHKKKEKTCSVSPTPTKQQQHDEEQPIKQKNNITTSEETKQNNSSNISDTAEEKRKELGLTLTFEHSKDDMDDDIGKHNIPPPLSPICLEEEEKDSKNKDDNKVPSTLLLQLAKLVLLKSMSKHAKKQYKQQKRKKRKRNDKEEEEEKDEGVKLCPTPIQLQSWPILTKNLSNHKTSMINVIGIAPTGSGKTFAYGLPLVLSSLFSFTTNSSSLDEAKHVNMHGLVLVPTRELAQQVAKNIQKISKCAFKLIPKRVEVVAVYGGVNKSEQIHSLLHGSRNDDDDDYDEDENEEKRMIVVATPGRLLDLLSPPPPPPPPQDTENEEIQNKVHPKEHLSSFQKIQTFAKQTQFIVIDEADRMASNSEMSRQVDDIFQFIGITTTSQKRRYVCLFSATFPSRVKEKFYTWVCAPRVEICVDALRVGKEADEIKKKEEDVIGDSSCSLGGENGEKDDKNNNKRQKVEEHQYESDNGDDTRTLSKEEEEEQQQQSTQSLPSTPPTQNNQQNNNKSPEKNIRTALEKNDSTNTAKTTTTTATLDLAAIPSHVTQTLHVCSNHKKPKKLMTTLQKIKRNNNTDSNKRKTSLCIVFFGRIKTLQYIAKLLVQEGIKCIQLHSKMNQTIRDSNLNNFRCGKIPILLATDIAARGIHINNVEYIINYDFPTSLEQYVHRCGRAGRNKVSTSALANDSTSSSQNNNNNNGACGNNTATVYSFFHRELAPMAGDVISLLRTCKAWIDPNLIQLAPSNEADSGDDVEGDITSKKRRRGGKRRRVSSGNSGHDDGPNRNKDDEGRGESKGSTTMDGFRNDSSKGKSTVSDYYDNEDDDGYEWSNSQFASLSGSRIVLKRASHVSDAEDSDDD